MPYADQMELVIILWLGFMGYIAYLGKEKANRLWVGMLVFLFVANFIALFIKVPIGS